MRTIAAIACKGGSGKTTVATHLAIGAHTRGRSTVLADTDPQASSYEVLRARRASGPAVVRSAAAGLVAVQVSAARSGADILVIDTPAGAEDELGCALALCDLALLVVRPTFLDLAASLRTVEIVRRLRKPAIVVLSQAPAARAGTEPPAVIKALRALEVMRLPVAPAIIRLRQAYQTALESGRSVEEVGTDPAAAHEAAELVEYVERFAFGPALSGRDEPRLRARG